MYMYHNKINATCRSRIDLWLHVSFCTCLLSFQCCVIAAGAFQMYMYTPHVYYNDVTHCI